MPARPRTAILAAVLALALSVAAGGCAGGRPGPGMAPPVSGMLAFRGTVPAALPDSVIIDRAAISAN